MSTSSDTAARGPWSLYKREPNKRVFVNRSLMLEKVKFFGFDMDYTLAGYKSPEYEILNFNLLKDKLMDMGYPAEIKEFEYDPLFPIRGLWFDNLYGTLLKVDAHGNILVCVRGFQFMNATEIKDYYPTKFVIMDEARFRIFNTLYELPLIYLIACLVHLLTTNPQYTQQKTGVKLGDVTMTFQSMFNDLDSAMGYVHNKSGPLKDETVKDVEKYVEKDDRLPVLLQRLRERGKKVFLATNSDYKYTNKIMTYLFDTPTNKDKKEWVEFFDFIVVDAKKPLFFSQGTILRQVNRKTGGLHLGAFTGKVKSEAIYSGGSIDVFNEMIGMQNTSDEVLYVGDHIFGDILKSKKNRGWRTFLIVPELSHELSVWTDKGHLFHRLADADYRIAQLYKNLDSSAVTAPDISEIKKEMRDATYEMDLSYGTLGSLFRTGSFQTFFAYQVMRYSDLYAATFMNLLHYPLTYCFRSPPIHMPHESTVDHEAIITDETLRSISRVWKSRLAGRRPEQGTFDIKSPRPSVSGGRGCAVPRQLTEVSDDFLYDPDEEARSKSGSAAPTGARA